MQKLNKMQFLHIFIAIIYLCATSVIADHHSFCGKIKIQAPFLIQNSSESQLLNRMVLCKSQKLYFRTSAGLYQISSIDYSHKLLTIPHVSTSSSSHFISPSHLSAGFPPPPQQNLLVLYNCTNQTYPNTLRNCTHLHGVEESLTTCLIVDDMKKLPTNFHPKDLNCSHHRRVFKSSALPSDNETVELGTRICFDIPDHVPSVCDQCQKPGGNCGVGLRCVCHPKECKDKVISVSKKLQPSGNILIYLIYLITVISLLKCS